MSVAVADGCPGPATRVRGNISGVPHATGLVVWHGRKLTGSGRESPGSNRRLDDLSEIISIFRGKHG